jgi:hypothetical protein
VASLKLSPGSWVIFATVALAATGALCTTVVRTMFALDGNLFGQEVQTDFTFTGTGGFRVVPPHHGDGSRQAENSAGRVQRGSGEHGLVSADDDHCHQSGIGYAYHVKLQRPCPKKIAQDMNDPCGARCQIWRGAL